MSNEQKIGKNYGGRRLIIQASLLIMLATGLSRVLGLVKNVLLASYFGTEMVMDAYWIAFIVPMLFFQFFTSGMNNYVPLFTHEYVRHGKEKAWEFGNLVIGFHFVLILLGVAIGVLASPLIVRIIVPGAGVELKALASHLTRILMAITFFMGFTEVLANVFYAEEKFTLPTLGGVVNNIIILVVLMAKHQSWGIYALVIGVVAGSLAQLLLLMPGLWQMRAHLRLRFSLKHQAVRQLIRLSVPTYFSQAGNYLSNFTDKFFASMLPVGAISALSYAFMVVEIPSSVITLSLLRAVFPSMSARFGDQDHSSGVRLVVEWLNLLMLVLIPFTLIFIILGKPILQIIFERGSFDVASTHLTWQAFVFYSLGIPATAISGFWGMAFFADKETRVPVILGLLRVAFNIVLNALLVGSMGVAGLALSTSLSNYFKLLLTKIMFERRFHTIDWRPLRESLGKIILASVLFVISLLILWHSLQPVYNQSSFGLRLLLLSAIVVLAIIIYLLTLYSCRQKDVRLAWQMVLHWRGV